LTSANAAFIALLAADVGIGEAVTYKEWAMSQIHYMLGDNKNGFSYVIDYGTKYPRRPHHRARYRIITLKISLSFSLSLSLSSPA
jgi:endoglucanase